MNLSFYMLHIKTEIANKKTQIKVIPSKNRNRFHSNEFCQTRFSFGGIGAWRSLQSDQYSKNGKTTCQKIAREFFET